MITNPIIPVWLMTIICIFAIMLVIYNKQLKSKVSKNENNEMTPRQKNLAKQYVIDTGIKIGIIALLFAINLRFMIPNGENTAMNSDVRVLFAIDKSVSMKALDYNGNKERFEGVINDCCYIVDELSNCKFSIITFGDSAQKIVPFTSDTDMVQSELKSITLEDDNYAEGTSLNIVKEILEKTLKEESQKQEGNAKIVLFFVSDGEITKENEKLDSFASMKDYLFNGAVMGYGTKNGGKMVSSSPMEDLTQDSYYVSYYDENNKKTIAVSKIDESNLKQLASDFKIDYIQMSKTSNIDYKISDIKEKVAKEQSMEEKIKSYKDIYYYFAIPLAILLVIHFIIQKRRM